MAGLRLLSDVAGGLILSVVKPLEFHAVIALLLANILEYYKLVEMLNNFVFHHLWNDFYQGNNLDQIFEVFLFLSPKSSALST